jgi:hypothetical protein
MTVPRKAGRPPVPEARRLSRLLGVKLTTGDAARLFDLASASGTTPSLIVRAVVHELVSSRRASESGRESSKVPIQLPGRQPSNTS